MARANAEIAFEGHIHPGDLLQEGPLGEWTGYYAGGTRPEPAIRIATFMHRDNPILVGAIPAVPPNDNTFYLGTYRCGAVWNQLEAAGVPEIRGVWAHEAGGSRFWLTVSIKQLYGGHSKQAGYVASQCHAGAYANRFTIVVDDDIDPTNINEVIWEEDGKDTPGVWDGHWQVDNARNIKFLSGEKQPWQPLKYENDLYHCGPRERCIPSPAEQKLSIAEAYVFGAATSRNIEGRFLSALIKGEPDAREAWTAIAQYNHFLVEHRELYHQAEPEARIALISAEPHNPLADEFLKQSVFFETKVLAHLDKGVPLDRFKVLVMPADLSKLSAEQKARLDTFTAGGGVIMRAGKAKPGFVARVEAAAGGPRLSLEPRGYVLGQLTRKPDGRTLILHLLNYNQQTAAENVKVRLELNGLVDLTENDLRETNLRENKDLSQWEVKVLSPDMPQPQFTGLSLHGCVAEFTLNRIEHYTVVTFSPNPGP